MHVSDPAAAHAAERDARVSERELRREDFNGDDAEERTTVTDLTC